MRGLFDEAAGDENGYGSAADLGPGFGLTPAGIAARLRTLLGAA